MKRRSFLKDKAAPEFYENVGKHIIEWLDQNRGLGKSPSSQKELCRKLDFKCNIEIAPAQLSRYIHGINIMPGKIERALVDDFGFNSNFFAACRRNFGRSVNSKTTA